MENTTPAENSSAYLNRCLELMAAGTELSDETKAIMFKEYADKCISEIKPDPDEISEYKFVSMGDMFTLLHPLISQRLKNSFEGFLKGGAPFQRRGAHGNGFGGQEDIFGDFIRAEIRRG